MDFLIPFLIIGGIPVAIFIYLAFIKKDKEDQVVATEQIAVKVEPPAPDATTTEETTDTTPEEHQPIDVIVSVRLVKKVRGKILSTIATLMTIGIWAMIQFGMMGETPSLANAIRSGFITNPVNLIGIAALVSGIGWWFDDSACMLLSGIALVGAVIFDITAWFVLIPAVLFGYASKRLVPQYFIDTISEEI